MLLLIFFLCISFGSVLDDERLTMYEDFSNTFRGEKTIQACLSEDLKVRHCSFFSYLPFWSQLPLTFLKKLLCCDVSCRFAKSTILKVSAT